MSIFPPNTTDQTKGQKDTASRLQCGGEMLELADWELETTMINMLKVPMGRSEHTQKQMGNVIREMEILRKNGKKKKKKPCCTSKTRAEMQNALQEFKSDGRG